MADNGRMEAPVRVTDMPGGPRVHLLPLNAAELAEAEPYADIALESERVHALARALVSSPGWMEIRDAVLVARTDVPVRLAFVGYFDNEEEARLEALAEILPHALRRSRYVAYGEAERLVHELAEKLIDRLGATALTEARFVAQPRGGLFVLGMLAYTLGLRREQIGEADPERGEQSRAEDLLVLVDDCALTGLRFRRFLERCVVDRVVFAHLFSHPELRRTIELTEPRVVACVAARELTDYAPDLHGDLHSAWLERWKERSAPGVYWLGLTEHVCFAWSEPDLTTWNSTTDSEEAAWRFVPPEFCLGNRPDRQEAERLQVQADGKGSIGVGSDVVYARRGERIIAAHCSSGRAWELDEIASEMWTLLLSLGDPSRAAAELADRFEADPSILQADVEAFTEDAVKRGLLALRATDAS